MKRLLKLVFLLSCLWCALSDVSPGQTIRVIVWDEQQPKQLEAYSHFLGNQIASHLKKSSDLSVVSVSLNDPGKGLPEIITNCDVVIWWGHRRHDEITSEEARRIVERIKDGRLAMISLHSAHWSTPFVEAMNEKTRENALNRLRADERASAKIKYIHPELYKAPGRDARLTPSISYRKFPNKPPEVLIHLPNCCFPAYRGDGKPSYVLTLRKDHPIADGIPDRFQIPETEMYDEPFHVPEPDEIIFEERWETGEWFRSGSLWKVGQGEVFYFRPGHESFAVYREPLPLRIIENAVRYLARSLKGGRR